MSGTTIKEFLVGLGFEINESQLKKFNQGIFRSGVAVTALGNIVADAAQQITGALVNALSPNRYANELDALQDISERTNIAVGELMQLGYVATLTGSDVNTLTSSMESFNRTAGLAAMGLGRGKQVFEDLGISVKGADGQLRSTIDLLTELRGKIAGLETGQQQAILSRLGIDPTLVQMMTQDISGLLAEYEHMRKQAGFSADDAAKNAALYRDELDRLGYAINLTGQSVAARLYKPLADSTMRLRQLIVDNMPRIIAAIEKVIKALLYVGRIVSTIVNRIIDIIGGVIEAFKTADEATNGWLSTLGLLLIGWRAFNASMLATPVGMVLALAAAIAALVEDFYVWQQGGESLINWGRWEPGIRAAMDALYELRDLATALFTFLFASIDFLTSLLTGDFAGAWNAIKEVVLSVIEAISRAFGFISNVVGAVKGIVGGATSDQSLLAPSPAQQAQLSGMSQNVNQETNIIVQGGEPEATGRAVAGQQNRVNADMTRNLAPRAR